MIRFECVCGAKLKADDGREGYEFDCPKCGITIRVPGETIDPPPIPISVIPQELPNSDRRVSVTCLFCATGRAFLISGFACLVLGMLAPSVVMDEHGGYMHNDPKAIGKISVLLAAISLTVAGSVFRARSKIEITNWESNLAALVCLIVVVSCVVVFVYSLRAV